MRIITHDDGRCLTLRLVGELDHAAAQTVMPGIEDAVEEYLPRRCVLDLTGVSFMDSSGIAVILKTDRLLRQTGGALALAAYSAEGGLKDGELDRLFLRMFFISAVGVVALSVLAYFGLYRWLL